MRHVLSRAALAAAAFLLLCPAAPAGAQTRTSVPGTRQKGPTMPVQHATGSFEVKMAPQAQDTAPGATLGRMSLDKTFQGDLEAAGRGEMLTAITETQGSAVYVAVERVTGTLHGRTGTFALAHMGTMNRGSQELTIQVVPDSGTGELAGIAGTLAIRITDGKHFYDLAYTLPQAR